MPGKVTVYVPDNLIKKGYVSLFKEMFEELRSSRFLMWQLFKRDIKSVYKQSVLGVFCKVFISVRSYHLYLSL